MSFLRSVNNSFLLQIAWWRCCWSFSDLLRLGSKNMPAFHLQAAGGGKHCLQLLCILHLLWTYYSPNDTHIFRSASTNNQVSMLFPTRSQLFILPSCCTCDLLACRVRYCVSQLVIYFSACKWLFLPRADSLVLTKPCTNHWVFPAPHKFTCNVLCLISAKGVCIVSCRLPWWFCFRRTVVDLVHYFQMH